MQKERKKLPFKEAMKQSHLWATSEAIRRNRPQDIPALHPDLDENGDLREYPAGHPLYRPKEDKSD